MKPNEEENVIELHPATIAEIEAKAFTDSYVPMEGAECSPYDPLFADFTVCGKRVRRNPNISREESDVKLRELLAAR